MMNQFNNPSAVNPCINPRLYNYQQPQNGIIWVQGIEGAKAYQLQPNCNAVLMDSETDNRFYIKVSDNVGMCTLRIFEYSEITDNLNRPADLGEYVKKSELKSEVESLVNSMLGGISNESTLPAVKSNKTITK